MCCMLPAWRAGAASRCPTILYRIRLLDRKLNFHFDRNGVFTQNHTCTLINASMNYVCLGLPPSTDNNFNVNWCVCLCVRAAFIRVVGWMRILHAHGEHANRMKNKKKQHTRFVAKNEKLLHKFKMVKCSMSGGWCLALWYGITGTTFKVSFSQITNIISVLFSFAAFRSGWIGKMCY